ncbi:hypothetical protein ABTX61_07395, partial [Amycolatopsis japonica]|uniref:hypothetical protein n=1 Tax=Amycolatopsis japonica TaxID=208439 RepID=UPI003329198B
VDNQISQITIVASGTPQTRHVCLACAKMRKTDTLTWLPGEGWASALGLSANVAAGVSLPRAIMNAISESIVENCPLCFGECIPRHGVG